MALAETPQSIALRRLVELENKLKNLSLYHTAKRIDELSDSEARALVDAIYEIGVHLAFEWR